MQLITPADAAGRVTEALKGAAQATGAGFDYLVRTAKRESALNLAAQNPASSARGLFQFIDSTWLQVTEVRPPGDTRPELKESLGPTWGLHLYDVNVAMGDLVSLARDQAAAWKG